MTYPAHRRSPESVDVLIFDDCSVSRASLVQVLESVGLRVSGVGSALEATRAILREKARLVVVDTDARGIDCDRLIALVRGVDRLEDLKVIMVCADRSPTTLRLASTAGADGVYVKTDGTRALLDMVCELLDVRPASGTHIRPTGLDPKS